MHRPSAIASFVELRVDGDSRLRLAETVRCRLDTREIRRGTSANVTDDSETLLMASAAIALIYAIYRAGRAGAPRVIVRAGTFTTRGETRL